MNYFTPSRMLSLDDVVLRYSFLSLCLDAYLKNGGDPLRNPYISPLLISDRVQLIHHSFFYAFIRI